MNEGHIRKSLALWGMEDASFSLAAARENAVYRVEFDNMLFALRFHRAGYRNDNELESELSWMEALAKEKISVPNPITSLKGKFCHVVNDTTVDVLSWLEGQPMGRDGLLLPLENAENIYRKLGQSMARVHSVSDEWRRPKSFSRPSWDSGGLLGEEPLWGRFWENPSLSKQQSESFLLLRAKASNILKQTGDALDYGLIHADLVPENVLVDGAQIQLIDFDDGGFGYRLFDIATTLNRAKRTDAYDQYKDAFLNGYQSVRTIDLALLPLFQVLRSLTYVGWIISRYDEPGAARRNDRFIKEAISWASVLH